MTRPATGAVLAACLVISVIVSSVGFGSTAPAGGDPLPLPDGSDALVRDRSLQLAVGESARTARWEAERRAEEAARQAAAAEEARRQAAAAAARRAARAPTPSSAVAAPDPGGPGRFLGSFTVTCYALQGTTASGRPVGEDVVAVDPRVIPLGTSVHIGGVGWRVAADTGGDVKGNRLDIWKPSREACIQFGRQVLPVHVA